MIITKLVKVLYPDGKLLELPLAKNFSVEQTRYVIFDLNMKKVGSLDRMPGMYVYVDNGGNE